MTMVHVDVQDQSVRDYLVQAFVEGKVTTMYVAEDLATEGEALAS